MANGPFSSFMGQLVSATASSQRIDWSSDKVRVALQTYDEVSGQGYDRPRGARLVRVPKELKPGELCTGCLEFECECTVEVEEFEPDNVRPEAPPVSFDAGDATWPAATPQGQWRGIAPQVIDEWGLPKNVTSVKIDVEQAEITAIGDSHQTFAPGRQVCTFEYALGFGDWTPPECPDGFVDTATEVTYDDFRSRTVRVTRERMT